MFQRQINTNTLLQLKYQHNQSFQPYTFTITELGNLIPYIITSPIKPNLMIKNGV